MVPLPWKDILCQIEFTRQLQNILGCNIQSDFEYEKDGGGASMLEKSKAHMCLQSYWDVWIMWREDTKYPHLVLRSTCFFTNKNKIKKQQGGHLSNCFYSLL